ncbi:hypothetical protein GJ744_008124 [Endocarpon pusillum]|uniref:Uncharacterized protein n=1 Tax=Endocarpon pusillum TaxID=364733 RepID=A0A8H7ALR5_9EURO|nr:hypothetical protein GJ744_008124 [Endocarpon pusillum]
MAYTPKYDQSGGGIHIPASSLSTPPRKPPTIYLGRQQLYNQSIPNQQIHDHLKREHGSISSTSTDSSPQGIAHPTAAPMRIYAPIFSFSSQAEQGTLEIPRSTRAYPDHYTRPSRSGMAEINAVYQHSHEEDELSEQSEDHAIWVVFWLSLLDPLYCILAAFYTIIILFPLLLITPLYICNSACDLPSSIVRFVSPVLRRHLNILCAEPKKGRHNLQFNPISLIMVYLAAPMFSLGVAIAAWVSASFWVFAIIMGNPDGTERRDDGRATVLAVRNWWERCLLSAVR